MRKNNLSRLSAVAMVTVMIIMMAACSNEKTSKKTDTTTPDTNDVVENTSDTTKEEVETTLVGWAADLGDEEWSGDEATLSLISEFSPDPSSSTSWWEDEIRKYTGVTFRRESSANGKLDAVLVSGELTDIIGFQYAEKAAAAAESGLLINLDDYKDQLPNIYANPLMESALSYWREYNQGDSGGLYVAPLRVGNNDSTTEIPMIRYDLYQEIGSPEPTNMDEYFQMIKDMADANPIAEDGDKCYGIVGWNDWKGSLLGQNFMPYYGWFALNNSTVYAKGDGSSVVSVFDEAIPMKTFLKNMNNMWNTGYIHPDSLTMDYSTAKPLFDSGHGLLVAQEWMGGKYNDLSTDETGNMTVWAQDFEIYINSNAAVGENVSVGIAKDCDDLDAALRFLNWYFSPTAYNIVKNGPEGYLWEYTDDGKQIFTADGIEKYRTNREEIGSGGDLFNAQQFLNAQPYTTFVENPTTGQPLYHEYWNAFYETEKRWGQLEWRKVTGYTRTVDMAFALGCKTKSSAFNLVPAIDTSLEASLNAISDAWDTYTYKLLVAKDDAEFESLWNEAQKECNDLGQKEVYEWYKAQFEQALNTADKYPLNMDWDK